MSEAILCPACGAKVNAAHDRCPRCRARFRPDPDVVARHSKQLAKWSAGLAAVFVLGIGGLWLLKDDEPAAVTSSKPVDPFASRRQPKPDTSSAPAANSKPDEPSTPFLEPSGAGASAYATGDYQSALEQYKAAIAKNPDDAESHSNLGQILVRLGKPAEAIPHFEKAISLIPDRWAYHFNLARALSVLGKWDESITAYRQAQQRFPNDYATTFNLALTLHKKGDDQGAVEEYKKAIAMSPSDASFHFALALSYERLQRTNDAVAAYEKYLRLAPAAGDADKVRARIAQLTSSPAAGTPAPSNPGTPQNF